MLFRSVEMQVYTGSNNFVDFLMGSSSFADLLRRSEILGELNAYESEQIKALNKEKEELYQDKEKVQKQKDMLETQKASLKNNKEKAVELKAVNDQLMSKYRKQEDELLDAKIRRHRILAPVLLGTVAMILQKMIKRNPNLQTLIDCLHLELVDSSRTATQQIPDRYSPVG